MAHILQLLQMCDLSCCRCCVLMLHAWLDSARQTYHIAPPLTDLSYVQGPTNIDVVGLLVELGASVDPSAVGTGVETPLHLAARSGRLDMVHRLLTCRLPVGVRTKVSPAEHILRSPTHLLCSSRQYSRQFQSRQIQSSQIHLVLSKRCTFPVISVDCEFCPYTRQVPGHVSV